MTKVQSIIAGVLAASAAFATSAFAGSNYEAGPTVGDNGAVAGLFLLLAIGAVLLLKKDGVVPPAEEEKDESSAEE